jgi:hypothetical protein
VDKVNLSVIKAYNDHKLEKRLKKNKQKANNKIILRLKNLLTKISRQQTMGISQSPICNHKYLNHPLFGQVALDDSLQNNYHCVTIEASYTLSDPTSLDRWLNALNCHFDGIRADEKDGF